MESQHVLRRTHWLIVEVVLTAPLDISISAMMIMNRKVMGMKIKAAILWEQSASLSVEEAELEAPRAGEILVEVKSAGVCHSDLHPARGDWPARTPLVLGHEGAGVVREVGEGVTRVRTGDHIVFCWAPPCGICPPCLEGRPTLCDRLERTVRSSRVSVRL